MIQQWFDQLGDWNPQLFRELKGRLKSRNLLLAAAVSAIGQLLLVANFIVKLPSLQESTENRFCTGISTYSYSNHFPCLIDGMGEIAINWQLWWLDVFVSVSLFGLMSLLTVGTYLLLNDLNHEERRGTLNFIRLSPQSTQRLLVGKMLGVPSLLYLVLALAMPLHLIAGLTAQISPWLILGFDGLVVASVVFFYSLALLFGIASSWLGGFQAWFGGGALLLSLLILGNTLPSTTEPSDWLHLFSPATILVYLIPTNLLRLGQIFGNHMPLALEHFQQLQWFNLPVGTNVLSLGTAMLVNFGVGTYWIWQALQRCFRNPNATTLSKHQSYLLVASFEVAIVGFASSGLVGGKNTWIGLHLSELLGMNLIFFLVLMLALSPHRQALQDWARYRREQPHQEGRKSSHLLADLIWAEKSPAIVTMALNLTIAASILLPWVAVWDGWESDAYKFAAAASVILTLSMLLVYAVVVQLMVMMKNQWRISWAIGTIGAIVLLPVVALLTLSLGPEKVPAVWLLTAFPWLALEHMPTLAACFGLLAQWTTTTLLSARLTRQIRRAGDSASKALLQSDRLSLPM